MTSPSIVPTTYQNNATDYLNTKVDKGGRAFFQDEQVSVPSGTTTTTIVGLIPFNAGCKIGVTSSSFFCAALSTSVTLDIGVIYSDNVANTNNQTLFVSASTAAAAGGAIPLVPTATNVPYITTGDGWIVATIGGATTGTTGIIYIQALLDYFSKLGTYVTN